ncbi:family 43 glycosylhydrolase [Saccharothrix sp. NRRL B-16314]|uniref:family 43 glycosylhydrolase n=1 Tax=Saccharothrix sp. NRRL B-16314 TaxID=1463825 RepID=UPI0009DCC3EB|nr:family 43 glycosylhydrolase [Saccharothrix sp. NRRL B-16314]
MIRFISAVVAACAVAATVVAGTATADDFSVAANESTFPLADPDTVLAEDGRYVTYGTTVGAGVGDRCGVTGKLFVPVLVHGSGSTVGMSGCAAADAMPGGPGSWAEGNIWAPGVVRFGDRFFMYYTASKRGTGQKCIGRAVSGSARGPFTSAGGWACPPDGRWAIDANPFVAGGQLHVAYRDDAIAAGAETGISVVATDANGWAVWSTRRDALKSTDITWDTRGTSGGTHVVENPSMFRAADGVWYLAYSGNNWDSARYSTGIARCAGPLPGSRCTPLQNGVERPYFGFTGDGGLDPYRGLPGNHRGPGGMDVFTAADGTHRVVYHWWNGSSRFPITGVLARDAGGFLVR